MTAPPVTFHMLRLYYKTACCFVGGTPLCYDCPRLCYESDNT